MIKIAHKIEVETLKNLPVEVIAKALEIATILDDNYGKNRCVEKDLGGYILIAKDEKDVEVIRKKIDLVYNIPEYLDYVSCCNGESYTCSLLLLSSDYSISVLIPLSLTPKELLKYTDI